VDDPAEEVATVEMLARATRVERGKFVLVQRLSSCGVATRKKVILDANSSATFRVRLHHGRSRCAS